MRTFAGVELGRDAIPDETTVLNFRHLLERYELTKAVFAAVAEHLEAQRASIARRIEHLGHAARVISFPGRAAEIPAAAPTRRRSSRWIVAAAVAGLFVGLILGTLSNVNQSAPPVEVAVSAPAPDEPLAVRAPVDDDTFLRELELASIRQRARAISPLDAFTPTVREVTTEVR